MTTKVSYTLTRALSTLKSLDTQIASYFSAEKRILVSVLQGDAERTSFPGMDKAQLKNRIQSDIDGIEGLLERRRILKSAIVTKNATTKLTICEKEYSIAEAIELKKLVPLKEAVLKQYRQQYAAMQAFVNDADSKMENRRNELIKVQTVEGASPEEREKIATFVSKQVEADFRVKAFDPMDLPKRIVSLEEEIRTIRLELDVKLSELNSTTVLDVEFP